MVRAAKKAPKGDDAFKDRKQKTGRKKLAPATATRAEVHARTLRINNAVPVSEIVNNNETELRRNFTENVVAAHHYRANVRMGALGALCAQMEHDGFTVSPVHRLQGLQAACLGLIDTDNQVRERAVVLTDGLLRGSEPDPQTLSSVLQHVHIALTHAVFGVRKSGVDVIEKLVSRWPGALATIWIDNSIDAMQIVRRTHDVVMSSQKPNVATLAKLLKEMLFQPGICSASAPLARNAYLSDNVGDFFSSHSSSWLLHWKELMEMQYGLFRDESHAARAVALGELISTVAVYLNACGKLDKSHSRMLREVFINRVPFSMQDLCSRDRSADGAAPQVLAHIIATGCAMLLPVPLAQHEAQRSLQVYLAASLSSSQTETQSQLQMSPLECSVRLLNIVASASSSHLAKFSAMLPPLLQTATKCTCNLSGASTTMVGTLSEICHVVSAFLEICEPSGDLLLHLASAISAIPRLLFAARRLDEESASTVARANLELIWRVLAARHPVLSAIDTENFTKTLQSIFGIASPEGIVSPGIVDVAKSPDVQRIGTHIFFYLGVPPASVHHSLPVTLINN